METAPNAIAEITTASKRIPKTGKRYLLFLSMDIGMKQLHQFQNILSSSWSEINNIMFFKTINPVIFSRIG
jgi:hypothetical protein